MLEESTHLWLSDIGFQAPEALAGSSGLFNMLFSVFGLVCGVLAWSCELLTETRVSIGCTNSNTNIIRQQAHRPRQHRMSLECKHQNVLCAINGRMLRPACWTLILPATAASQGICPQGVLQPPIR
jgi:hypothetical protein